MPVSDSQPIPIQSDPQLLSIELYSQLIELIQSGSQPISIAPSFQPIPTASGCQLIPIQNEQEKFSYWNFLALSVGLAITVIALIPRLMTFLESKNKLNYDRPVARRIAGFFMLSMPFHTKQEEVAEITDVSGKLITLGPHRTGVEALAFASKIKGTPPRIATTDGFNFIPGGQSFLKMFGLIPVASKATRINGQGANEGVVEHGSRVLEEKGCFTIFPQGNLAKLNQQSPSIYPGVARIAIKNAVPVQVIRIDGLWCIQNPLIPTFIRNNRAYRSFFSLFHPNNIRIIQCFEIDFHLRNKHLTNEEKVREICAQLYACYRHTQELLPNQLDAIKQEIAKGRHQAIWDNRVQIDSLEKQLTSLKVEIAKLKKGAHPTILVERLKELGEQLNILKTKATELEKETAAAMLKIKMDELDKQPSLTAERAELERETPTLMGMG